MKIIQRFNKLKKLPIKHQICFLFIGIFTIIGATFGIYTLCHKLQAAEAFASKEQPIEMLTIKAVPIDKSGESITIFTTDQISYKPLALTEGLKYTLVVESNFTNSSEITVCYDSAKIKISGNQDIIIRDNSMQISVGGDRRLQTEIIGLGSACFFDGLTIENENKCTVYASSADFLKQKVANTEKANSDIVLLNNIDLKEDFYVRVPCNLLLNSANLNINGDLIFETTAEGVFTVENNSPEQITVKRFFAEAPHCDIKVKNTFFDFKDALGYYINAKSYNCTLLEACCRTVKSEEMLLSLLDNDQYPRLNPNTKIIIDSPLSLDAENLQISVPVSFKVYAAVSASSPITIKTWDSGNISIEITENGSAENLFVIESPECNLSWSGKNIPSDTEVSEHMNVKTYNGEDMTRFGLGGNGKGKIISFSLSRQKNKKAQQDLEWSVSGNVIFVSISYLVSDECFRNAVLDVKTENGTLSFNKECVNEDNSVNLLNPCTCIILDDQGNKRTYSVRTERMKYNLPVVNITIDGYTEVTSLEVYKKAEISIDSSASKQFSSLDKTAVNIKGRGHSTWKWDKKPYKLKFNKDTSVLGLTAAKEWVLLSNYSDKTLIRNYIAMEMEKVLNNMTFAPTQYPVDLFVNGTYRGVYTIGEQIEADKGRVEIDKSYTEVDTGYLLEIGGPESDDLPDKDYFDAGTLQYISIKSPKLEKMSKESFNYIKAYVSKADAAVISLTNYEDYIDVDSLIDWLILHEMTYNIDSGFRRSCYITKDKGGKLKMGPIWDFDLALGNFSKDNPKYDDWATAGEEGGYVGVTWINYLLKDESFRNKLKDRWDAVKEKLLKTAIDKTDEMVTIIEPSQQLNFAVWKIWDIRAGYSPRSLVAYNTYEKQIKYLKDFLYKRYKWLDANI